MKPEGSLGGLPPEVPPPLIGCNKGVLKYTSMDCYPRCQSPSKELDRVVPPMFGTCANVPQLSPLQAELRDVTGKSQDVVHY